MLHSFESAKQILWGYVSWVIVTLTLWFVLSQISALGLDSGWNSFLWGTWITISALLGVRDLLHLKELFSSSSF